MDNETIVKLEEQLKTAMINSDHVLLDNLLADDLIFTNHLGQIMTKEDDLNAHRSGFVNIISIEQSEQKIALSTDTAIISVLANIHGRFGDTEAKSSLRFTRVWQKRGGKWLVTAAQATLSS